MSPREAFGESPEIEVRSAAPGWISIHTAPEVECKDKVVRFFRSQLIDLPEDLREKLGLAVDELLGNAIEHGAKLAPKLGVDLTFIRTERMVLIHVKDAGPGFSMNEVAHAAVNNPPEEPLRHIEFRSQLGMRPGGFGIMLVKQVADELVYNEQGNEVIFLKYLDGASRAGSDPRSKPRA
ncbi:MAG TPA: ATP-binding protein [Bryobacteraceae bacterium]|nr:ATP-binding protein [Bryobacteraceae bacterium]